MLHFGKFSSKYALAFLILVAFLLLIYGISGGDYQPKSNISKSKREKGSDSQLKTNLSKTKRQHGNALPAEESEYMTQPQAHLQKQRLKEEHILAGIKKDAQAQIKRDVEHTFEFRIVHLDLKGAPPRVSYYEELFPFLKQHGANGVLIEYEDMFPYTGQLLENIPAFNAYTVPDIKEILRLAKVNHLEVIPLIQTFGHLEFFLKLKYNIEMREVQSHIGSICPSHNRTKLVLEAMIDQVIKLHPGVRYLHIGCDEVYELGKCSRCLDRMKHNNWNKGQLFLNHVLSVAKYIRTKYPEVMPLMWEDMFRTLSFAELSDSGVSRWVEPVVWNYHPNILMHINSEIWSMYAHNFKNIWIASAFKGATAPDQLLTNYTYHLENHMSWMAIVEQFKDQMNFRGIMMTGWQRYDHFAVLCELFPVGIPSLVLNLYYIQNYKHMYPLDATSKLIELLGCEMTFPPRSFPLCNFPGARVFSAAQRLYLLRNSIESSHDGINNPVARGWLSYQNIKWNFSNPHQVEAATGDIDRFKMELYHLKADFRKASADIFDKYTVEEWIEGNVQPLEEKIDEQWQARELLMSMLYWPRRPFNLSGQR